MCSYGYEYTLLEMEINFFVERCTSVAIVVYFFFIFQLVEMETKQQKLRLSDQVLQYDNDRYIYYERFSFS